VNNNTYFVTFGSSHPFDNLVVGFVCNDGMETVRQAAHRLFGSNFAFLYQANRDAKQGVGVEKAEWFHQRDRFNLEPIFCLEVMMPSYGTEPSMRRISNSHWEMMVHRDVSSKATRLDFTRAINDNFRVYFANAGRSKEYCAVVDRHDFALFLCNSEGEPEAKMDPAKFVLERRGETPLVSKLRELLRAQDCNLWEGGDREAGEELAPITERYSS
jgi:hypothetical protein